MSTAINDQHPKVDNEDLPQPFRLPDLEQVDVVPIASSPEIVADIELDLRIELGNTLMRLDEVLKLRGGSVVALEDRINDPVNVYVNQRLIARGELLTMDGRFCVRVLEMIGE